MNPPMHSVCGQDHDPTAPCPPPGGWTTRHRIQWGVLFDDGHVLTKVSRERAECSAQATGGTVVHRYITTTDWLPTGHDGEDPKS